VVRLFDTYAGLLTERQRVMLRLYYHDDLSLGEIGRRCRVTRQAVFDSLRRSVRELRVLEARVGAVAERERRIRARRAALVRLAEVERLVSQCIAAGRGWDALEGALRALRERL
jgi:predicted DNA-binding protein YlxM (UPF0122 family)